MNSILFATTNQEKMLIAKTVSSKFNLKVKQAIINIDEIQGEDAIAIVKDKALRAYEKLSQPVVISDDSWDIPGLRGFPGPYMKSINKWFEPVNFINLMSNVKDNTIILHQYLAYCNGRIRIFRNDLSGKIIDKPRGESVYSPNMLVTVLDDDNGKTIAEVFNEGVDALVKRYANRKDVWHEFAEWYSRDKFVD